MSFLADQWPAILSISMSLLALFISIYSLYLKRLDVERERLAREITFGPIDEDIVVDRETIENRDTVDIQLINDTGIQQIVDEVWIDIEQYPKEVSEEQYARFKELLIALMEAGFRTMEADCGDGRIEAEVERDVLGNRTLYLLAMMIVIVDRIEQDDTSEIVVDESLYKALRSSSHRLDDMVEMLRDPKNDWIVRKLLTPQIANMIRDDLRSLMSDKGYPLSRSMRMSIPPVQIKTVHLDIVSFAELLYDRLDMFGGQFDLLCRLHAHVHKGKDPSRSELFQLRLIVEPLDIDGLVGDVEEGLKGMGTV